MESDYLKAFNLLTIKVKFKLDASETLRESMLQGQYMTKLDLSDAFFHIPIHPNSRKFLRFGFKGMVYQYKAMPMGL